MMKARIAVGLQDAGKVAQMLAGMFALAIFCVRTCPKTSKGTSYDICTGFCLAYFGIMYPSDLTDTQWARLEPLLQEPRGERHAGGRPREHPLRRIVDALLYVVKTGCQWCQLPANFPPWKSVHEQFRGWRDSGVWERVTTTLR